MKTLNFVIVLFLISSSCATKTLWEKTDPNEYIKINYTDITEKELQKRDAKYIRDGKNNAYYVSKSSFDKFKDYSLRTLGTPVTIVVDATAIVLYAVASAAAKDDSDKKFNDPWE